MKDSFEIPFSKSGYNLVVVSPDDQTEGNNFVYDCIMASNGITIEKKRPKLKKLKPMNLQKQTFTRRAMQFSLKNPNYSTSLIRMRFNINGTRGSYYLPQTYKFKIQWRLLDTRTDLLESIRPTTFRADNFSQLFEGYLFVSKSTQKQALSSWREAERNSLISFSC